MRIIEGKTFTKTFPIDGPFVTEPIIASLQADFPICEADYLRLKNKDSKVLIAALRIFLSSVGIGLLILGKFISNQFGCNASILVGEWIAFAAGVFISVILYIIHHFLPNEKKDLMKKMGNHFKNAPRTRHLMKAK